MSLIINDTQYAGTFASYFWLPATFGMDTIQKGAVYIKDGIKKKGTMTAKVTMPNPESAKVLKLKLTYQACTTEHCLFPKHIVLTPGATAEKAAAIGSAEPNESAKSTDDPTKKDAPPAKRAPASSLLRCRRGWRSGCG
jgi:hypothetical protein